MTDVIIALGSNYHQEQYMLMAKQRVEQLFHHVIYTQEIWTEPIGITSDRFLNCLAYAQTTHGFKQIRQALIQIERKCGSSMGKKRIGLIQIDIDILLFGQQRHHEEDWNRPYVKRLMEELHARRKEMTI